MNLGSRIARLEKAIAVPCTLCGGRGKLVLWSPHDPVEVTGCDRCGRVKVTRYPLDPPPGTPTRSIYMHQCELRDRRRSAGATVRLAPPARIDARARSR